MSFAQDSGLNVYRLVFSRQNNNYDVTDGLKKTLLLQPLDTFEEAIEFMYKDSVSRGNEHHKYVLVEN